MKFDKEATEGALLGILLMKNDYVQLGRLYAWMHADSHVDITMPRLLKTLSSAMNRGYVEWAFVDDGGEIAFKISEKGFTEAVIRIQVGKAWLPEHYEEPAGVEGIADKFCAGVIPSENEDKDESEDEDKGKAEDKDAGEAEDEFSDIDDDAIVDLFANYMNDKNKGDGIRYLPHDESDEVADDQEPSDADTSNPGIPADKPENHVQYCAYCHAKNDLRDNFCRVCGHKMDCRSRFLVEYQRRQRQRQQQEEMDNVNMLYKMLEDLGMLD